VAFHTATTLETSTGAALRLYVEPAAGRPRGVVQISHGLCEHAGRYSPFARFLAGRGFHVYAHDHRGHGATAAPATPRGSFGPRPAARNVLADVLDVHRHVSESHPDLPVFLFGQSMGAMVVLAILARRSLSVAGVAAYNMPFPSRFAARAAKAVLAWERFRLGSDVPSRLLPRFTFQAWADAVPDACTPFDWLSRDRESVGAFMADPSCGLAPAVGVWEAVFDFSLAIAAPGAFAALRKDLPIRLVGGGADPVTSYGRAVLRLESHLRRKGFLNLETSLYAENRHESLNELNRNLIMGEFATWAERVSARRTD
jgi:Lysophospholipase